MGKSSVATAARYCSFIGGSCRERKKLEKQPWSWWVFHFVECTDIYTAHCSLTPVETNLAEENKPDTFKNLFLCEQQ